jgi:hypothetical protein
LFIPDPDPDFLLIPDPGVKKAPDPGSGSATLKVWQSAVLHREQNRVAAPPLFVSGHEAENAAYLLKKHLKSSWISYQNLHRFTLIKFISCERKSKATKFFRR